MVKLTKIYTKTGDKGTTSLGDMSRVSKTDARIHATASVDRLNSYLGVVLLNEMDEPIRQLLVTIQNDLFDVGADICTPVIENPKVEPLRILQNEIEFLERKIDEFNKKLPSLKSFVLPSGSPLAAHLHVARTLARDAERDVWAALEVYGTGMSSLTAMYLNRLSDMLFVLARIANKQTGEILWIPGEYRDR